MKLEIMIALGGFVLMSAAPLLSAQAQQGVKCDDERHVCRDKNGLNVELTRQRYGDQAANRVQKHQQSGGQQGGARQGGGQQGGGQQGVKCDDGQQVCRDKNGLNVELTRQRYGDQAANRVQKHQQSGGKPPSSTSGTRIIPVIPYNFQ